MFKGEWEDGIGGQQVNDNMFCGEGDQRDGLGAERGVCGVRRAFVFLLVSNRNTFQNVFRVMGVLQLGRKTGGTGRRAIPLSPCGPGQWEIW